MNIFNQRLVIDTNVVFEGLTKQGTAADLIVMYTLTQKVTLAKLAFQKHQPIELTPEQIRLLAQVRPVSEAEIA